ncbi:MAG: NAD(P)H-dependent oxidoreductase [Pseudomonadota bacterium]
MSDFAKQSTPDMTILRVDSSGRTETSDSRALVTELIDTLSPSDRAATVIERDLAKGIEFVDDAWIGANFTQDADRNAAHHARLAGSEALVGELEVADILVIGMPIYNFGIPAALKAWIDQVARARRTFHYTEAGPQGLLTGKKVFVVITSGGTEIGGPLDFVSDYLRHVLGFLGMKDVTLIAADRLMQDREGRLAEVRHTIADLASRAHAA